MSYLAVCALTVDPFALFADALRTKLEGCNASSGFITNFGETYCKVCILR